MTLSFQYRAPAPGGTTEAKILAGTVEVVNGRSGILEVRAASGRLFLVDVWQFDTLLRIVSFLVLGAVLLVLGFFYNRFAEQVRRWW